MAEPYTLHVARVAQRASPTLDALQLAVVVRAIQVDQLDVQNGGARGVAALLMGTNPTHQDTLVIGADTYEFLAGAATVANDANIAVAIGGSAAVTAASLVAAINATDADNEHPTINNGADTAPALANGTESVFASLDGTTVSIVDALSPGGDLSANPAAPLSIVLNETFAAAGNIWACGNINTNLLGGNAAGQARQSQVVWTAANVAAGDRVFRFPFTVRGFTVQVRTAAGLLKHPVADAFVASGTDITLTLDASGAPEIVNGDIVTIVAFA
jgi:hypothetical protein